MRKTCWKGGYGAGKGASVKTKRKQAPVAEKKAAVAAKKKKAVVLSSDEEEKDGGRQRCPVGRPRR